MENFDSKKELERLDLKRLFSLQKMELQELKYFINNIMYDKNDLFRTLQEIDIINYVITQKINSSNNRRTQQ